MGGHVDNHFKFTIDHFGEPYKITEIYTDVAEYTFKGINDLLS